MNTRVGDPPSLALVGYRGTGKSTVGRLLAGRLGLAFLDADAALEARHGRSVREVFDALGEPVFRDWEEQTLAALTAEPGRVVATGGGVVLREPNRKRLRDFGLVVWLTAPAPVLADRLAADPDAVGTRPALTPAGTLVEINEVLAAREPLYRSVADVEVSTEGRTPAEVSDAVLAWLSRD
jgi:shikimate kinase